MNLKKIIKESGYFKEIYFVDSKNRIQGRKIFYTISNFDEEKLFGKPDLFHLKYYKDGIWHGISIMYSLESVHFYKKGSLFGEQLMAKVHVEEKGDRIYFSFEKFISENGYRFDLEKLLLDEEN